jgi:hypothetical protein
LDYLAYIQLDRGETRHPDLALARKLEKLMYLSIYGFLVDLDKDDSLKFELDLDLALNEEVAQLLGHRSLHAMTEVGC